MLCSVKDGMVMKNELGWMRTEVVKPKFNVLYQHLH